MTALALLLLALVTTANAGEANPPKGSLQVDAPVHDAGKVERGVVVKHGFVLKNVGATELSIHAKPG